jgi:hypothetical protein
MRADVCIIHQRVELGASEKRREKRLINSNRDRKGEKFACQFIANVEMDANRISRRLLLEKEHDAFCIFYTSMRRVN